MSHLRLEQEPPGDPYETPWSEDPDEKEDLGPTPTEGEPAGEPQETPWDEGPDGLTAQ